MIKMLGLLFLAIILFKIIKSAVKVGIMLLVIVVLFKVGFVWSGQEISEKLFLDRIVKEEYQVDKDKFLSELVDKRDRNSVIEGKEVEKVVRDVVSANTKKAMDKLSEEETKEVLKELYTKIETIDTKDVDKAIQDAINKNKNKTQ